MRDAKRDARERGEAAFDGTGREEGARRDWTAREGTRIVKLTVSFARSRVRSNTHATKLGRFVSIGRVGVPKPVNLPSQRCVC